MFEIDLPFSCDTIPSEHHFGALVRDVHLNEDGRIERIWLQAEGLAMARLSRLWVTEDVRTQSRNRIHYAPGITPPEPRPLVNPSISLHAILLDGREVTWYWLGNGFYDGWSAGNSKRSTNAASVGEA